MKEDYFFNCASKLANESPLPYKHGAVLVKGGKILASGYNFWNFHAEDMAIKNYVSNRYHINFRHRRKGFVGKGCCLLP